jgi:dihydrofolate reductase
MIISIIAAMAENGVIGNLQALPWNIPEDLKRFKKITLGHPVIMGRKTFDSIGRPLPGRENVVISRQNDLKISGTKVVRSLQEAFSLFENLKSEIFILGGGQIFKEALPYAHRLYLTLIRGGFPGDVFFPEVNWDNFTLTFEESHHTPIPFIFKNYEKKT